MNQKLVRGGTLIAALGSAVAAWFNGDKIAALGIISASLSSLSGVPGVKPQ